MTYAETARRFARAETSTRAGFAPDPATLAADKLAMSEWGETRRDLMSPATIAANHALHVSGLASELREALAYYSRGTASERTADVLADAAHALLAAIGEAS